MKFEEEWKKFLRFELYPYQFPRDLLEFRTVVSSMEEYIKIIRAANGRMNVFTSLYSYPQVENKIIDVIFLDLDAEDFADAEAKRNILEKILKHHDIKYRLFWSGQKGYHFYIPFPPVKLSNPKLAIRRLVEKIISYHDLVDYHVVGDLRRLVRVPYTIHPKTCFYSFECRGVMKFEYMINPPPTMNRWTEDNEHISLALLYADLKRISYSDLPDISVIRKKLSEIYLPECIARIIEDLRSGYEVPHRHRLHLAAFLRIIGVPLRDAVNLFRTADDFDEKVTLYHLKKIYESNFLCHSCVKAAAFGICPYPYHHQHSCPYYPSINIYLARRR